MIMADNTSNSKTLWTIGHSTHSIELFTNILKAYNIQVIADIRRHPGSRKYPQFDQDALIVSLASHHIHYTYIPELAGRRKARPDSANTVWRNQSFRGYADYMETSDFLQGIRALTTLASEYRTAIMCAESVWWKCHRSMVADYMKSIGWTVIHIINEKQNKIHPYTSAANIESGRLTYHPNSNKEDKNNE